MHIVFISNRDNTMTKLTDAQFGCLHALQEFGPKTATEVVLPPSMNGKRKVRLEWNGTSSTTLSALEHAGFVHVARNPAEAPRNAVGKRGHARRHLTISITDAGRAALATA